MWIPRSSGASAAWATAFTAIDGPACAALAGKPCTWRSTRTRASRTLKCFPPSRTLDAAAFLARAIAWYAALGVRIRAVLTDNGACYRSRAVATLFRQQGILHKRTRPYTPRTNGKVERVTQTLLREWAYFRPYPSSQRRTEWLARYLTTYNEVRTHSALNSLPPMLHLAAAL